LALSLAAVAFLVPDYDAAIAWFCGALGFELIEDSPQGEGKRWVVVAASRTAGARLLLAKAEGARQREAIGEAAGGRVGYFLETDDFARDHAEFQARGVKFLEQPRREPYGTVAVFADPWDGKWDLIEPARQGAAP
jgi:catechol 2,3-dioxygenase-like lactoylglutathione lyase family enzyme